MARVCSFARVHRRKRKSKLMLEVNKPHVHTAYVGLGKGVIKKGRNSATQNIYR